eukprot:CAMPEP_0115194116 /NCGR_PEP_ID=MMETSP0270-20121206/13907_1 /TAXON_ID=71861 /ORGANISM="Scrippsiella trochoidea, Strain CCMP3099" /LENGTH=182 /DNA_ID=CAMNT_0002607413 /DNA_START=355 /DNA_END=904 /DNA_ORIENTATION=-
MVKVFHLPNSVMDLPLQSWKACLQVTRQVGQVVLPRTQQTSIASGLSSDQGGAVVATAAACTGAAPFEAGAADNPATEAAESNSFTMSTSASPSAIPNRRFKLCNAAYALAIWKPRDVCPAFPGHPTTSFVRLPWPDAHSLNDNGWIQTLTSGVPTRLQDAPLGHCESIVHRSPQKATWFTS